MKEFPYKKFRKGQKESISALRKNLGSVIVLKAPTGFGKTVVALIAHREAEKVLYAVRTRNEMVPVIREARKLGYDFSFIYSGRKMCPLLRGSEVRPEDFWVNCRILRSRGLCDFYSSLDRVPYQDELTRILEGGESDPRQIVYSIVTQLKVCPFFALVGKAYYSKVVVVTYPYLFQEEIFRTAFTDLSLSDFYVIVDEAHTILNPQSIIEGELDELTLDNAIKEVKHFCPSEEVLKYLVSLRELLKNVRSRLLRRIEKALIHPGEGILQLLEDTLMEIKLKQLRELVVRPADFVRLGSSLNKVLKFLDYVRRNDFQVYGVVDRAEGIRKLKVIPTNYDIITERLSEAKGVLLMSGTMPPKEVMDSVCGEVTVYVDVEEEFGNVFPRENTFYAVVTFVSSSYRLRAKEMYLKYADLLTSMYESLDKGVILAVYPSYQFMDEVTINIVDVKEQVIEGRGTTYAEVLDAIISGGSKAVIHAVASGKFTEGIELLDGEGRSLIKVVALMGVPYPQPDDYLSDLRRNLSEKLGSKLATDLTTAVPAAIRSLQAVGRAIRSGRDRAFIVLADRRFLSLKLRSLLSVRYDAIVTSRKALAHLMKKFFKGLI
ncbi:MAG: hypothetical protein J7J20_02895 [Desulfurococcales archaeon]|nr:hypothetical protein [Desulfurococcales archaeon]